MLHRESASEEGNVIIGLIVGAKVLTALSCMHVALPEPMPGMQLQLYINVYRHASGGQWQWQWHIVTGGSDPALMACVTAHSCTQLTHILSDHVRKCAQARRASAAVWLQGRLQHLQQPGLATSCTADILHSCRPRLAHASFKASQRHDSSALYDEDWHGLRRSRFRCQF